MIDNIENEHDKGMEIDVPSFVNDEKMHQGKTRKELELLTGKELARMADPKSDLSFNTLKGKGKSYLIDIILGINEEKKEQPKGRAPQGVNQSEDILNVGLTLLQGFKQQREGEEAQLNPLASQMFKDSAITQVDKARAEGIIKVDKFNTLILALSGTALVIDGVIGFKNIPGLLSKLKAKVSKKAA